MAYMFGEEYVENQRQRAPSSYSLIIETTTSAGGVAIFGDGVAEFTIQLVSQGLWDTFPG